MYLLINYNLFQRFTKQKILLLIFRTTFRTQGSIKNYLYYTDGVYRGGYLFKAIGRYLRFFFCNSSRLSIRSRACLIEIQGYKVLIFYINKWVV